MTTTLAIRVEPELYARAKKSNIVVKRVVETLLKDYLSNLEEFNRNYTKHQKDD